MMIFWTRFAALATVASLTTLVPAAGAQGSSQRFAYINSQKIMTDAPGRAAAESTYSREMVQVQAQLKRMDDSLNGMVSAFEKDARGMDSVKREGRAKQVRDRQEEYQKRAEALNQQMQQRQAELARPLMEQISKVIEDIRVQGSYTMIFDVGAAGSPIVAADKSLDLTDQVLARLKQMGPPKPEAASSVPAAGPTQRPAGISRPR